MHATAVAIDLAKDVFALAFADAGHRSIERKRLKRAPCSHVLENREVLAGLLDQVAMHETAKSAIDAALREFPQRDGRSQRLQTSGGVVTATAMSASIGNLDRFPPDATSPVRLASHRADIPAAAPDGWATSPSAAIPTCACCSSGGADLDAARPVLHPATNDNASPAPRGRVRA